MAVPRAGGALGGAVTANVRSFVARPPQRGVEFGLQKLLYEAANARANPAFQGIEPIIAQKMIVSGGACGSLRAISRHGVISVGALTPILVCFHKLEITPLSNFNPSRDGTAQLGSLALHARKQAINKSARAIPQFALRKRRSPDAPSDAQAQFPTPTENTTIPPPEVPSQEWLKFESGVISSL